MRGLFNHPIVLADGASPGARVEGKRRIAVSGTGAGMDRDVGRSGRDHTAVAPRGPLFDWVELDSGGIRVRGGNLYLLARRGSLQLAATGRAAGSEDRSSAGPAGDDGDSGACAASGVSRPFVRDGGMERGDGVGSVLGTDGVCGGHGRSDDSAGR